MATRNQFVNDNFAIFLDGILDSYKFDINISDWIVYPTGNCIDIGIRIYNISNVNSLYVYVPYKITSSDIQDLAPFFGDEKVARAITNTYANITTSTSASIIEIKYTKRTDIIVFLSMLDCTLQTCENGTIICFSFDKIHSSIKENSCYVTFRIPHESLNKIFEHKKPDYRFSFDSPIITCNYQHTIKINEFRALPLKVRQMFSLKKQCINKVIFFLTSVDKINISNNICENIRPLEYNLLESYIPQAFKTSNPYVYQWMKFPSKYFSFSFECSTHRIQLLSLLLYSLIIITLAISGNILWELLKLTPLFNWLQ